MSILAGVSNVQTPMGIRLVIAAVEKMGKTTLSCNAPRALLVPLEQGYAGISVHKTAMLTEFLHVIQMMDESLATLEYDRQNGTAHFPYKSIVFDSLSALEKLIHIHTISLDPKSKAGSSMETAFGGYGKAYPVASDLCSQFLQRCDTLAITYGINIVLTCHVFAGKVIDPTSGEYDCWDLLLHSPKNGKTSGKREIITQWADMIGFLHEPMLVSADDGSGMVKGVTLNKGRVLGVERTPGYVAGNRYGLNGELSIPEVNGWNVIANAIKDSKGIDYINHDVEQAPTATQPDPTTVQPNIQPVLQPAVQPNIPPVQQ